MLLAFAIAFAAASPATDAGPQTAEAKEERKICKRDAITGSRSSKRICKTAAEWKATPSEGLDASKLRSAVGQ